MHSYCYTPVSIGCYERLICRLRHSSTQVHWWSVTVRGPRRTSSFFHPGIVSGSSDIPFLLRSREGDERTLADKTKSWGLDASICSQIRLHSITLYPWQRASFVSSPGLNVRLGTSGGVSCVARAREVAPWRLHDLPGYEATRHTPISYRELNQVIYMPEHDRYTALQLSVAVPKYDISMRLLSYILQTDS